MEIEENRSYFRRSCESSLPFCVECEFFSERLPRFLCVCGELTALALCFMSFSDSVFPNILHAS